MVLKYLYKVSFKVNDMQGKAKSGSMTVVARTSSEAVKLAKADNNKLIRSYPLLNKKPLNYRSYTAKRISSKPY